MTDQRVVHQDSDEREESKPPLTITVPEHIRDFETGGGETHTFIPKRLHKENGVTKLVYRYLRICQNATIGELVQTVGSSEAEIQDAVHRLLELHEIKSIKTTQEETERVAIIDE